MTDYSSTDDGLRWWALHKPDKRAIVVREDALTYAELDAWVDRVAAHLAATGVRVGDRVGIVGGNSMEWAVAGLATLRVGAVHAALGERLTVEELHGLTTYTDTRTVYVAGTHLERMREVSERGPAINLLPLADVVARRTGEQVRYDRPDIDADTLAAIVYSSGSTGMPKGIALSMAHLVSLIHEWAMADPAMGHEAKIVGVLPLSPMGGFINSVLRPTTVGGTVFLQPKFDPEDALRLLVEEKCSSLMAPPLIFQKISALPGFTAADLSTLTYAIIGGAPVPLDEFDKWFAQGASLRQVYGSTESGGHFSVMPAEGARENPAGCGRGNIYRRIKIVRLDGAECEVGEDGEILVRGPSVMMGYWDNKQATDDVLRDGWLHTGDLGRVDETGVFTVTDRIKEVIISGGYNIGPVEVESVILQLEAIEEAIVIPVPDQKFGETVAALVTLASPIAVEEIIAHCNSRLADYKVPRYLLVLDEPLPRTEQGKYAKMEARRKYTDILLASPRVR